MASSAGLFGVLTARYDDNNRIAISTQVNSNTGRSRSDGVRKSSVTLASKPLPIKYIKEKKILSNMRPINHGSYCFFLAERKIIYIPKKMGIGKRLTKPLASHELDTSLIGKKMDGIE